VLLDNLFCQWCVECKFRVSQCRHICSCVLQQLFISKLVTLHFGNIQINRSLKYVGALLVCKLTLGLQTFIEPAACGPVSPLPSDSTTSVELQLSAVLTVLKLLGLSENSRARDVRRYAGLHNGSTAAELAARKLPDLEND
jgi:hypothetical protein